MATKMSSPPAFRTSNCVALGVPDKQIAARHYREVLGFEEGASSDNWVEMRSGALRLFLCEDEVRLPCFDLEVEDVEAARSALAQAGWKQVDLAPNDVFMQDPFGYTYCLSAKS
jgi:catechol 2,3-dioxygenase-like lactoylglutathione lyase family enzyme